MIVRSDRNLQVHIQPTELVVESFEMQIAKDSIHSEMISLRGHLNGEFKKNSELQFELQLFRLPIISHPII